MNPLSTPDDVRQRIDKALERLDSWSLQLPRLDGPKAESESLQGNEQCRNTLLHCVCRIRFFSFRAPESIDKCIADFEENAKKRYPRFSRHSAYAAVGVRQLPHVFPICDSVGKISTDEHRGLLQILVDVLDAELDRILESQMTSRASTVIPSTTAAGSAVCNAQTGPRPRTPSPTRKITVEQSNTDSVTTPSKRRRSFDELEKWRKIQARGEERGNRKIEEFFTSTKRAAEGGHRNHLRQNNSTDKASIISTRLPDSPDVQGQNAATSFETTISSHTNVFSLDDTCDLGTPSSEPTTPHDSEESQDYFPSQDVEQYFADESFNSEFNVADSRDVPVRFSWDNIGKCTPFRLMAELPLDLPFWVRWEIYRVALATGLPPTIFVSAARPSNSSTSKFYYHFWSAIEQICKHYHASPPQPSITALQLDSSDNYESGDGKSATFVLELIYCDEPGPTLWKLVFNPIKLEESNRIHRRFGADRHIVCSMKALDKSSLPKWIAQSRDFDPELAFRTITDWLASTDHWIAGRIWSVFYAEPPTKPRRGGPLCQKLHLFATSGVGLRSTGPEVMDRQQCISISQFVNWHVPLTENHRSTDLKLFSRFGLALSKTRATVCLKPHQFRHLKDKEPVMNDGCSLMSFALARSIYEAVGGHGAEIPSAFQGRISGAKGLWIIDYGSIQEDECWIEISDSQLKILPHPRYRIGADESQRTFEVIKWSKPCVPGRLNIQLINILANGGVSRTILKAAVVRHLNEYATATSRALEDPELLVVWLQTYHLNARSEREIQYEGGFACTEAEEIQLLVESGCTAKDNEYVRRAVRSLAERRLNMYADKLWVEIPHSTTVFCVPDPYKVLEENEVFLGFSQRKLNPRTGFDDVAMAGIDVLVARTPAALASDIQKRKAVYRQELRHYKDKIVFSTKGNTPLASLLSGGDYDGDTVLVIWDPALVDNFRNSEKPPMPTAEACGLENKSILIRDVMQEGVSSEEAVVQKFIRSGVSFNMQQNRLGMCTTEHENLIYSGVSLSDPGAILLATLAGFLVDANKQGLYQSDQAWYRVLKAAQRGRRLYPVAYKAGEDLPRRAENGDCVNFIDYLKFDVALDRKNGVLSSLGKQMSEALNYDSTFAMPYKKELERSEDKKDPNNHSVRLILCDLTVKLSDIVDQWKLYNVRRQSEPKSETIADEICRINAMIRNIQPLDVECDILQDFRREMVKQENGEHNGFAPEGSRWSLLRASTMYVKHHTSRITWWTVGGELARIKARSHGPTREILPKMHSLRRYDTKRILKSKSFTDSETDDEDSA